MKLALVGCMLVATSAQADPASDLVKQGLEQYRAGNYPQARVTLGKAYELDHKSQTLFALAQAERLDGDCRAAIGHYHAVIQQVPDLNVARLVQESLGLCGETGPVIAPSTSEDKPGQVTRDKGGAASDRLAVGALGVGIGLVALSGGLVVAASGSRDAAEKARVLEDHDAFQHRANLELAVSIISAGLGAASVGFAVYRWTFGGKTKTDVALVPTANGGALLVRW